ncbi:MAG: hypothetical protein P8074_23315 [Anaerolineales bacterium]
MKDDISTWFGAEKVTEASDPISEIASFSNESRGKYTLAITHLKLLSYLISGTIDLTEPPCELGQVHDEAGHLQRHAGGQCQDTSARSHSHG